MYLLDSHVIVWHQNDDSRLPSSVSSIIESSETEDLIISTASWWELSIKENKGKLTVPGNIEGLYEDWAESGRITKLSIKWPHIQKLRDLPEIHKDPFDRILVAQALHENLTVVTCDPHIPKYPGVKTIW